ncbi:unnamed protein product [Rotaria sordida]|uniref:Uncharacterized protein n=1 Tax=Rotaria sordida TaxID=392033 RepID=A0A814GGD4_9BILA|nr:unnamed protein product [Rotaria sordida]CAF3696342.1 unnamed protein product [Rotaria sordida]
MVILSYLLLVNSIKINQILNSHVINSTSDFQSNCSTCICQCIKYSLSSSTFYCYVNCYTKNDTCQVIISASKINSIIVIDQTSIVYFANYSTYATTTKPITTSTSTSTNINHGGLIIANTIVNSSSTRTSEISVTYATTKTAISTP